MNIERKIHYKAAGLYVIVGITIAAMLFFLYNVRKDVNVQREDIEQQHQSFALTNKLIYAVNDAQASVSLFVSTNDTMHIYQFEKKLQAIDILIKTLNQIEPSEKNKLKQISNLLTLQAANIIELNKQLGNINPLIEINKRIKSYKPPKVETSHIVTTKNDTSYRTTARKKNFFKRIKEVFAPEKDSTVVIASKRIDTLRLANKNSAPILAEVNRMTIAASKSYETNVSELEKKMAKLIVSEREISTQIASLLLKLHSQTLNSILISIEQSEKTIHRNYIISIIGGAVALCLILLFVILIIYDVNKGKEAREKIKEVLNSRHQLLLSVTHDIKSPLSSILGYLELRKEEASDMKSMQNSAQHILALLENLLEYSSLEQGTLTVNASDFSLNEIGDEVGKMFLPLADAKKLMFTFESDTTYIKSDKMKIKQITINLVSNAIKYTKAGEVDLKVLYENNELYLIIKDTGAGIPEDQLTKIFEPFSRVESNNALAHGTGLGMFVVRGLIELLGGEIDITSSVGLGTEIIVSIPCIKVDKQILYGSRKIAVFDDDPAILSMASSMLIKLGHKVVEEDYDIILTDMDMGDLSGLDILNSAGNTPVVLMTGKSDFTLEKATSYGFSNFLPKPFTLDNLRAIFGEGNSDNNSFWNEDDYEEIMDIFRMSTNENMASLRTTLKNNDFDSAQAICHKMLPMFAQLGYSTIELRKMDMARGQAYEDWQNDIKTILSIKV